MDWLKVFFLGVIEGVTEFLPISSTGHLVVGSALLNFQAGDASTFEIFIQIGAVVAVLVYYAADIAYQIRTVRYEAKTQQFWLAILIAVIPASVVGILFLDTIEAVLFRPIVVAIALIVGGIAFIWAERAPTKSAVTPVNSESANMPISMKQAFFIGCWQILALIPGMSRSGMSILGGMFVGLNRPTATRFSFYMAIPILGGATAVALVKSLDTINRQDFLYLMIGAIISAVVAWFSIAWLLRYVAHHSFVVFGYYRIFAGIVIILLIAAGML